MAKSPSCLALSGPWQWKQVSESMGRTWMLNSTFSGNEGLEEVLVSEVDWVAGLLQDASVNAKAIAAIERFVSLCDRGVIMF